MQLKSYLILLFLILACGVIFSIFHDRRFIKKMSYYKEISEDRSLDITISSAHFSNRWLIINDSLTGDAINLRNDRIWLSKYLQPGDKLIKQFKNDTLYVFRGHQLEKFLIVH